MAMGNLTSDMADIWSQLAEQEREVLMRVASRLLMGQKTYGKFDLDSDARDFRKELDEEVLDALVYAACQSLRKVAA